MRIVMMKFDPTRTKDKNLAARLTAFLNSVLRTGQHEQGASYRAMVANCSIAEKDVGRILGECGATMKRIVDCICECLGHEAHKHGHRPLVQMAYSGGCGRFELVLYPPFNNESSFEDASVAVREMVQHIMDNPSDFVQSANCKMPPRLQLDDWMCPNKKCRNVCFARRSSCFQCGEPKPAEWTPAHLARHGKQKRIRNLCSFMRCEGSHARDINLERSPLCPMPLRQTKQAASCFP